MMWRLAVLALVGAAATAALLLGRRRKRRAARLRRRAERQARRAGTATTPPMDPRRPSGAEIAAAEIAAAEIAAAEIAEADTMVTVPRSEHAAQGAATPLVEDIAAASPAPDPSLEPEFRSIRGIGAALEDRLRAAGVTSVSQVAGWSDADIEAIAPLLRVTPERVRSQAWVEQARALVGGLPA
jgi:large subunit ribosomal protein L21